MGKTVSDLTQFSRSKKENTEKILSSTPSGGTIATSDKIMQSYLDGSEPSISDIKKCIRSGTIKGNFVPVLTGSAFKNKGVQPLLDTVIDYIP